MKFKILGSKKGADIEFLLKVLFWIFVFVLLGAATYFVLKRAGVF